MRLGLPPHGMFDCSAAKIALTKISQFEEVLQSLHTANARSDLLIETWDDYHRSANTRSKS